MEAKSGNGQVAGPKKPIVNESKNRGALSDTHFERTVDRPQGEHRHKTNVSARERRSAPRTSRDPEGEVSVGGQGRRFLRRSECNRPSEKKYS